MSLDGLRGRAPALLLALALAAFAAAPGGPALGAAGGGAAATGDAGDTGGDADVAAGLAAMEEERYDDALAAFRRATAADSRNADAWNGAGFALRKLGRFDAAFEAYGRALAIDPDHLGANEYLGELYLLTGEPGKAEERAAILRRACPEGCEELRELEEAIAAARAKEE